MVEIKENVNFSLLSVSLDFPLACHTLTLSCNIQITLLLEILITFHPDYGIFIYFAVQKGVDIPQLIQCIILNCFEFKCFDILVNQT